MTFSTSIILAAAPRRTTKKAVVVAQKNLFEQNLPPLRATASATLPGGLFVAVFGIAAILCAVAVFVIRKAEITV